MGIHHTKLQEVHPALEENNMGIILTITSMIAVLKVVETAFADRDRQPISTGVKTLVEPVNEVNQITRVADVTNPTKVLNTRTTRHNDVLRKAVILEQAYQLQQSPPKYSEFVRCVKIECVS